MATYGAEMAKYALGYANYTPSWKITVFFEGQDPITDIATAEIPDCRTDLVNMIDSVGNPGYLENETAFSVGPVDAGSCGGWFIVNGDTETDVAWVGTFGTAITIDTGDYVYFDAGTVLVRIN